MSRRGHRPRPCRPSSRSSGPGDHGGHYAGYNLNIDCFQRLKNDWYGSEQVLSRLGGGYVLRTDEDGDVRMETDGERLWVTTGR